MVKLTRDVVRQRAEHHDGILADLEEISLHQMEIEKIEVIGELCRKLRILYLQNNIISRIENIHYCKDLQYLNMALNNVTKIEGLQSCEFLQKLDLTVNFVDLDTLKESIEHLCPLEHFQELHMMGNPATDWEGFRPYVVAKLPQLRSLDGTEITKTEQIRACQQLDELEKELQELAERKAKEKAELQPVEVTEENAPWTPEARVQMYREMAEQKEKEEKQKRANEPPKRDYEKEQEEKLHQVRETEQNTSEVKQKNEAGWEFRLEDEDGEGNVTLRLCLPRFLDSSLLDVDIHPSHVTVVVKGKVFRVKWPEDVQSDRAKAQRSSTTGELFISVPKTKPNKYLQRLRKEQKEGHKEKEEENKPIQQATSDNRKRKVKSTPKLADLMMQEAQKEGDEVQITERYPRKTE